MYLDLYIDMSKVVATARAFLYNPATEKVSEISIVPDKRKSIVIGRIKRAELMEKALREKAPNVDMQVKWDGDIVKVTMMTETFPTAIAQGLRMMGDEVVFVRDKKGVEYDEKDVKQRNIFKPVLDELQYKVVYAPTFKRAVVRKRKPTDASSVNVQPDQEEAT